MAIAKKNETQAFEEPEERLKILHMVLAIGNTNCAYMELSLPQIHGYNITICTFFKADTTPPPEITLIEGDGTFAGFFRALNTALAGTAYDVIHAHNVHVGFLFWIARLFGRKKVSSLLVYTLHNALQNYKLRNKLLCLPVFATFDRIVCCSKASLATLPALYKRLAGRRLCSVQNGVNIDRVDDILGDHQRDVANGRFTVVSVGRLVDIKNPVSVLQAFERGADPSSSLIFIGEGKLREALITARATHKLQEQVELTGIISREKVYGSLASADLFVSASRGEGLPVAALEAMACGCPAVLSDILPHREIAGDVDFIPLIDPNDVDGFAREIRRFKQMSPTERANIGKQARKLAEEHFSLRSMHRNYAAVYAAGASGASPRTPAPA